MEASPLNGEDVQNHHRRGQYTNSDAWNVFAKNGRIHTDERQTQLLAELSLVHWDFVCFSETRCLSQDVFLEGGHRLITSLSVKSASGVGILIHHRFTKHIHSINCFSDRLMAVDFRF